MNDVFSKIMHGVDIREAAERYGVTVRGNMASCPFHQDKTPSMSFKNNRFRCFSCGESGSAVDLVQKLFGLDVMGAVERLNADFGLGIDTKQRPNKKERIRQNAEMRLHKAFCEWERRAYRCCVERLLELETLIRDNPPDPGGDMGWDTIARADREILWLTDVVSTLTNGSFRQKLGIYRRYRKEISEIEQARGNNGAA